MRSLSAAICGVVLVVASTVQTFAEAPHTNPSRVLPAGELPEDSRLGPLRNLRDAYHPWVPPTTKAAWEREAVALREQVLVSNGLWPLPPKQPLKPTIHGKIDRGDYTVEKVFFASHPGHYVSGSLYRPTKTNGKSPGVLCPHGHWPNGRFYDAGAKKARQQIDKGAEAFMSGARYPIQARLVQLARMGCVVFHYDMVGYADSKQIGHRAGFTDVEAGLRLQNFMGLQTFNSVRALDFLLSLPEVDSKRIAVTGASGGGTQTFLLCAIDPRPTVAFPAVMVSTGMQGGCVCENAEYLRQGINNIALAALFAPKPMAMSGAHDWTIEIETKGLPELRKVYGLFGKTDFVHAKAFPQFNHNYNNVSRTFMYGWFNGYLQLGVEGPIVEQDFEPLTQEELTVYDSNHPLPKDAGTSATLRKYLTATSDKQYKALLASAKKDAGEYHRIVGAAARVMLDAGVPAAEETVGKSEIVPFGERLQLMKGVIGRKAAGEQVPFVVLIPKNFTGTTVLWFDGKGKSHLFGKDGKPTAAVQKLLDSGRSVASADVFLTGEFLADGKTTTLPKVDQNYQGFTFGYNRPVLSNRVRDILTLIGGAVKHKDVKTVELIGTGDAGVWTLLATAIAGDAVDSTIADARGFGFSAVDNVGDEMFLPGALKYGGLGGLAALAAPAKLTVAGIRGIPKDEIAPLQTVYASASDRLVLSEKPLTSESVVESLLK